MHLRTTIALIVLAAGGGVAYWKGEEIGARLGLGEARQAAPDAGTLSVLRERITGENLARVEVRAPGNEPVVLASTPSGPGWALPGNWPVREPEVRELVNLLAGLESRFEPIPLGGESPDLEPYGLAESQKPVVVDVTLREGEKYRLRFGRPEAGPGRNPFAVPTYLRLADVDAEGNANPRPEVVRLGPDVLPVLQRPIDSYRQRRLFPEIRRVRVLTETTAAPFGPPAGGATRAAVMTTLPDESVVQLQAADPSGRFTLRRVGPAPAPVVPEGQPEGDAAIDPAVLAGAWEITDPLRDRPDPEVLRKLLTALPDLWAERFLDVKPSDPDAFAKTGLDKPSRTLTVTYRGNRQVRLLIGNESRVETRKKETPPSPVSPVPMTEEVRETYYYARLENNDQVFEVRGDDFGELFAALPTLRDPALVRFEEGRVTQVQIARPGEPAITLKKTKGDPKADSPAAREDRWDLRQPVSALAEPEKVTELLDRLKELRATGPDVIDPSPGRSLLAGGPASDAAYLRLFGLAPGQPARVTLTVVPPTPPSSPLGKEGTGVVAPPPEPRTVTVLLGRHDAEAKKIYARLEGWDRVNRVDEGIRELVERPALAYRSRKLFDVGDARVRRIAVRRGGEESFVLEEQPGEASEWKLTEPVRADAAAGKADLLAGDLRRLEATEYVAESPKPEELEKYGLKDPALSVTISFTGTEHPDKTLLIGSQREGKDDEFFARLAEGDSVFAIRKDVVETLREGSLAFLPKQLWSTVASDLTSVTIQRPNEEAYTLKQEGTDWKITAPFEADAGDEPVRPLADALARVEAQRYEAHAAKDPAAFGLDPASNPLRLRVEFRETPPAGSEEKEKIESRELLIGKEVPGDKPGRYARLAGEDKQAVFVVDTKLYDAVNKDVLALLDPQLLDIDPNAVTAVEARTGGGSVALEKSGGEWRPKTDPAFPVDLPTIDEMLKRLDGLRAERFAAYGPKVNWAEYGLDEASRPDVLTLTWARDPGAKPETATLTLGKEAEGGGRYARVNDEPGVAVLAAPAVESIALERTDFIDRGLFNFDPLELAALKLRKGDREIEIVLEGTAWSIVRPEKQPADQLLMEELADRLAKLRAERVAAFAPKDVKPFGLDEPAAVVTLELLGADKPRVLQIGGPVGKSTTGDRYAREEGSEVVAVLPGRLTDRLLAEPIAFRDRTLARFVSADRIEHERITDQGRRRLTFAKQPAGWKVISPVEDDAEDANLRELHDALARLRAEEIVTDKPEDLKKYGLDQPKARWKLFDGEKEVLDLLVGDREKIGEEGKEKEGFRAYAKLASGEKKDLVVLLDPLLTSRVFAEYRDRSLWEPLDVAQAEVLAVTAPGASFTLRKTPDGWTDPQDPAAKIDTETVNDTLDTLASLEAERYVADEEGDPKLYGLEPPQRVIVLTTRTDKRVLQLGRTEGGSKRAYARAPQAKRGAVFLLAERDTERLTRHRDAYLAKKEAPDESEK